MAATNALGQTLTLLDSSDGYLTNITGAIPGATTGLTYDAYGRVRTVTDSEGYTLTYDYDSLDRPTRVTYPDQTYEQTVYDKLDAGMTRDRLGRWSLQTHDALRHLSGVQTAAGWTMFD